MYKWLIQNDSDGIGAAVQDGTRESRNPDYAY